MFIICKWCNKVHHYIQSHNCCIRQDIGLFDVKKTQQLYTQHLHLLQNLLEDYKHNNNLNCHVYSVFKDLKAIMSEYNTLQPIYENKIL